MGGICSMCESEKKGSVDDQYQSLVVAKPAPIHLTSIVIDSTDDDIPLFAPAKSDDDDNVISDVETLTDTEINMYADKLEGETE